VHTSGRDTDHIEIDAVLARRNSRFFHHRSRRDTLLVRCIALAAGLATVLVVAAVYLAMPALSRSHCERLQDQLHGEDHLTAAEEVKLLSEYIDACLE
jgi:hypothetical protein